MHQATARLSGNRAHPMLHLVVATEDHTDVNELRERIDAEALPRLRQALDLEHLDADLLLRLDDARSPRAL